MCEVRRYYSKEYIAVILNLLLQLHPIKTGKYFIYQYNSAISDSYVLFIGISPVHLRVSSITGLPLFP